MAAMVARRYSAASEAMAAVAPDLRSPLLPFLPGTTRASLLPLFRLTSRIPIRAVEGVTITERRLGGIQVVVATPTQRAGRRAGVLWIHGGGYIVGSARLESSGTAGLARDLDVVAVSPEYRLAPEHPFPAALDDCMATLRWMRTNADELGIDPDRIAVIGASAGGGLAAAVAQHSHDEGIALRAQVLVYPMLDDRTALRAEHAGRGRFIWTPASNLFGWTSYLGRAPQMSDAPQYSAPARRVDLTGLPPAWIGVGELDLFYEEDVDYAARLTASGVPCTLVTVPGMYHGADAFAPKSLPLKDFHPGVQAHLRTYLERDAINGRS
jgi:acetyl esterase/lipase